jgi:hypothetical protein
MRRAAPLIYTGLALALAGPLLVGRGVVLAVDLAQSPHARLDTAYWGLPQGTHEGSLSRLPLDALFAALGRLDAVAIGQKVLLVAIVVLAGWGMHRLVAARRPAAALFAGTLYAANPFVYDRLYTGQWFLLLGYALIPLAYAALLAALRGRRRAAFSFAALFAATGVASPHMAMLLVGLSLVTVAAWAPQLRRDRDARIATALGVTLAAALSLWWALPTPGMHDLWRHVGGGQLELYRTAAHAHFGLVPTVAALGGYWNDANPPLARLAVWPIFALALVALAVHGALVRRRDPTARAVAFVGLAGFVLALGASSAATRPAFTFLLDHFAPLRSFREPQKAVALLAFAYAFLGAGAVDDLLEHAPRSRHARRALAAALLAVPCVIAAVVGSALWGGLHTSSFPDSWRQADAQLRGEAAGSRTLVLPWHGYHALAFAHHRVVANTAPGFFHVPVLASRSVGAGTGVADESDPVERRVQGLLAQGGRRRDLGSCLAALGVSHVLLERQADWRDYRFLDRQRDLVLERSWGDLALYRSRVPAGLVMTGSLRADGCASSLTPVRVARRSPAHYELAQALPPSARLIVALPQADGWRLRGKTLRFEPWDIYRTRYLLAAAGLVAFLVAAGLGALSARGLRGRRSTPARRSPSTAARPATPAATRPAAR